MIEAFQAANNTASAVLGGWLSRRHLRSGDVLSDGYVRT
jgi:hypothetical protein